MCRRKCVNLPESQFDSFDSREEVKVLMKMSIMSLLNALNTQMPGSNLQIFSKALSFLWATLSTAQIAIMYPNRSLSFK